MVARDLNDKDKAIRQLKIHLTRAQEHMRQIANVHRRDISFCDAPNPTPDGVSGEGVTLLTVTETP